MVDFAQDLHDVLDHVGPSVVVGYSMGGLVAQMVAADRTSRDLVRGLVLLCSVPPRGIVALSGPVLRASGRYLPAMISARAFLPSRADADAMMMNEMSEEERDRWFPRFIPDAGRAARQMAMGAVAVKTPEVAAPVLVVSAERDRISPPSIQPKLVRRYDADQLAAADHAHLIAIEQGWEAVETAVLDRVETW